MTIYNLIFKVSAIEIKETQGFTIKPNTLIEITNPRDIKVIEKSFRKTKKIPGVADIVGPDYFVKVNQTEYYLWATRDIEGGIIMKKSDTHRIYTIPSVEEILNIIDKQNQQNP